MNQKNKHLIKLVNQWMRLAREFKIDAAWLVRCAIVKDIQTNLSDYPSDLIIEALTYSGNGPCIISTDVGFYAEGFSWESQGNDDKREYVIHADPSSPQLTIKAALKLYIDNLEIE